MYIGKKNYRKKKIKECPEDPILSETTFFLRTEIMQFFINPKKDTHTELLQKRTHFEQNMSI